MIRLREWLARLRQPWRFVVYAGCLAGVIVLFTGSVARAVIGGLLGGALLSAWDALRGRLGPGE
jgi:membrane associated rhomboid family serine protease